ncbi:MAG: succinate dehydrogenase / fumarate reductase, flavoprotein subunit [Bacteroidota bacterium]|nr:succinate dehydrogenase / fumarate reductase, flavoprotein subunit [Bacteroidota bacterium]
MTLDSKVPSGPVKEKWDKHRFEMKLINPANKRKYKIIVVGTGLAGASAAASFAELGYVVEAFTYNDSPRRAHSIAAQGGINAAKNYTNDGDSIWRLFYDTVKGGDFRSREANVYRLAQVSNNIIDQCVAQGVPFAREYGGLLSNRSFGGAQVSRTFYARGQTGQQLLLGAYSALVRQIGLKKVTMHTRKEMMDIVIINGACRGIVTRDLVTGKIESHSADAVCLATGGYGNVFFLSTNAQACNVTATFRAYKKGALFANPCYTQIHPTCIPVSGDHQSKLTLMSESLRNDGRIWVPKNKGDKRKPNDIPENERDYYLERKYPSFGNLSPRDISSRSAKEVCDEGRGVSATGYGVYLDFADAIKRLGKNLIEERYGNLFEMYERITGDDPYTTPMMIYPASHYTMGGLWVDYNLMSTIPGLHVLGEANFSDHGANRLGASALMQGLADGYFVIPYTIGNYMAAAKLDKVDTSHEEFKKAEAETLAKINKMMSIKGKRTPSSFHRELGLAMWDYVGMGRNEAGLKKVLEIIPKIREEFWQNLTVTGVNEDLNIVLEKACRTADFLEFAEVMAWDALERNESCGAHFREEHQYPDGEAKRDDEKFCHVAAWEYK